jgi:Tfp pilus assembly protein PilF
MSRIDKLKEFLEATPNDSFLQHALALEYIKAGNDDEAKLLFEAILQREPNYVGSYYHLGKLLERAKEITNAITIYNKGMQEAKAVKDNHSYNELQGALEDLEE